MEDKLFLITLAPHTRIVGVQAQLFFLAVFTREYLVVVLHDRGQTLSFHILKLRLKLNERGYSGLRRTEFGGERVLTEPFTEQGL
jgi:hypothetical protein